MRVPFVALIAAACFASQILGANATSAAFGFTAMNVKSGIELIRKKSQVHRCQEIRQEEGGERDDVKIGF